MPLINYQKSDTLIDLQKPLDSKIRIEKLYVKKGGRPRRKSFDFDFILDNDPKLQPLDPSVWTSEQDSFIVKMYVAKKQKGNQTIDIVWDYIQSNIKCNRTV